MIPQASEQIKATHIAALEADQYSEDRKALWRTVFTAAQDVADILNQHKPFYKDDAIRREYEAADIVNHWYLDIESATKTTKDYRAHDRVTGFKTISQELKALEKEENRLAYETWETAYRKWWFGNKQGPKPQQPKKVRYAIVNDRDYETYGSGAWSEVEDEAEELGMNRVRHSEFNQAPCEDPENPFEDDLGCKRLAVRHRVRGDFKFYRGSRGVLGGVYTDTDPEPYYRTAEGRTHLIKALLKSDNVIDVQAAKGMNRRFKFPADKVAAANSHRS